MNMSMQRMIATLVASILLILTGCTHSPRQEESKVEIGVIDISSGMNLRRMIVHNSRPKGIVLFLHGFPETLYAWKNIALALGKDYEVHAFDWPGYGLSSRPPVDSFSYAPRDYAHVLRDYIEKSGIDTSKLVIYATDIGALPSLLLALEKPDLARKIIVGDFAPFDRPRYMYEKLQSLKSGTRVYVDGDRDEVLENAFSRGLSREEQFDISREFKDDMYRGWGQGSMSSADALYHYYSHFTKDQDYFESNLTKLRTPVKVIWGEKDLYIRKEMGIELANKANLEIGILSNVGHYPHLQRPQQTVDEIRAAFN